MPKVLVVDDTPQNVKLLADILTAKGFAPITAASGEEALAKLAAEPPDIVLLDIMMPGLSGYDVCKRIRADAATALLPVVLVTSLDPHGERLKGIEAGADDFVQKPFNQAELLARVRSLLRIKSLQDEVSAAGCRARAMERGRSRPAWRLRLRRSRASRGSSSSSRRPVADAIVSSGEASLLAPHRREICCVFTDLRGFTAFTDTAEPEEVMAVLTEFHAGDGRADRRARRHGAAFRGRRHPDLLQRSASGSRRRASALREWHWRCRPTSSPLRERWRKLGHDLDLGIGIARGFATLGAIGYEGRVDYSAIGSVVNLAARLCGEAQGGQTLIDRRTHAGLTDGFAIEPLAPLALKGFDRPVPAFVLLGA